MMACPEFEDLADGAGGDHAARCEACRALVEALAEADSILDSAFAGISAPPGLAAAVRARIAKETPILRPSFLPEVLDFIGWAAVVALAAVLLPQFLPLIKAAIASMS
jgi:hypothetical protein